MQPDLLINGDLVRITGREQALVKSKSGDGWHVVEYSDDEARWSCSCDGWAFRKNCRHIRNVTEWAAGRIDATVAPQEEEAVV